jgi:hypothetical protein
METLSTATLTPIVDNVNIRAEFDVERAASGFRTCATMADRESGQSGAAPPSLKCRKLAIESGESQ